MPLRAPLDVDSRDPFERGRQRGLGIGDLLTQTWPTYQELFAVTARDAGRPPVDVPGLAGACLDSLSTWSPDLLRELEGVAEGAGAPLITVMALNARTEILALARGSGMTECSTVVQLAGSGAGAIGAQTWDWHHDLADGWHLQTVRGDEHSFVGLTEVGMLAKIGVNDAGLGVHLNLLRHESDGGGYADQAPPLGGVPVHLVARAVLGQAGTLVEALELVRSAPVVASTVLTVLTPGEAACLEISPESVGVVDPDDGWLVHTNHFLDPRLASGEAVTMDVTTTFERQDLLLHRVKAVTGPLGVEELAALLCAHDEDGASVCRHVDADAPFGYRSATLATVALDPSRRAAHVSAGGPCRRTEVTTLTARC